MIRRALRRLGGLVGRSRAPGPRRLRTEAFGGIAQLVRPRALVFVDRTYMRELGCGEDARWSDPAGDGDIGRQPLSAPLEAHLQLTNRCDAGCSSWTMQKPW